MIIRFALYKEHNFEPFYPKFKEGQFVYFHPKWERRYINEDDPGVFQIISVNSIDRKYRIINDLVTVLVEEDEITLIPEHELAAMRYNL